MAMSIQRGTIVLSTQYNSLSEQRVVLGTQTLANLYFEEHIYIIRRYYNVRLFTLFSTVPGMAIAFKACHDSLLQHM